MNIQQLFQLGMKREVPSLIAPGHRQVNLGCGNSQIVGAAGLDLPEWDAMTDPIPYGTESIDTIFAFHFLEHLPARHVIRMLRECERVLVTGGTVNIVVPHRLGSMAYHDLDHKTFFTEDTWKVLFSTPYYNKNREVPWRFEVGVNLIIGIVERNLALMTQLVKR